MANNDIKLTKVEREVIEILKSKSGSCIVPGKDQSGYRTGFIKGRTTGFSYIRSVQLRVSQSLLKKWLVVDKFGYLYLADESN